MAFKPIDEIKVRIEEVLINRMDLFSNEAAQEIRNAITEASRAYTPNGENVDVEHNLTLTFNPYNEGFQSHIQSNLHMNNETAYNLMMAVKKSLARTIQMLMKDYPAAATMFTVIEGRGMRYESESEMED